jgi:hypothetical protein
MVWLLGFLVVVGAISLLILWVLYQREHWASERVRVLLGTEPFRRFRLDLERSYARLSRLVRHKKVDPALAEEDLRRLTNAHDLVAGWMDSLDRYVGDLRERGFPWFARRMAVREKVVPPQFRDDDGAAARVSHAQGWALRLSSPDPSGSFASARSRLEALAPDRLPAWIQPLEVLSSTSGPAARSPEPAAPSSADAVRDRSIDSWHDSVIAALEDFSALAREVRPRGGSGAVSLDVEKHVAALRAALEAARAASSPEDARQARRTMGTRRRMLFQFVEACEDAPEVRAAWSRAEALMD